MNKTEQLEPRDDTPPARWKVVVLTVGGVLPIVLLGAYALRVATSAVQERVDSANRSAAMLSAELVRGEFEERVNVARAFAALPGLIEAIEGRDEGRVRSQLRALVESDDRIVRAFVTEPDGLLWSDYPRAAESLGEHFDHRDWYRGVSRDWRPYVSEVYRRHAEPRPLLVAIAAPVRDGGSRVIGALVYQIRLEGLTEIMRGLEVGESGFVFLVDHTGTVVTHPELDLQSRQYEEYRSLAPLAEAFAGVASTGEYVDPFSERRVLATFHPVPVQDRRWVVVAQQPVSAAYAVVRRLRLQIGVAGVLLGLGAFAVVVGLVRAHDRSRRLNASLREARQELEHRVEERTAQLRESEAQLAQAQKMEAIGRLAGGIAHDFNNLLSVIMGFSDLLLTELDEDSPHRPSVDEIKGAGERASRLTRQLLAFGRRQVLQPRVMDLNEVVARTDVMLRRVIGEDIDVVTNLRERLHPVEADPGQIEQILLNLAVNARDAMPEGGKLTIETANAFLDDDYVAEHPEAQRGPHVMLAVTDTGHGMDEETRDRIFEPFFTTKEHEKGTGLGLATVYGIVKQSGGNIWVYSELERGTTFKIYLPRATEEAAEPLAEEPERDRPLRGSGTVLVVEDQSGVRDVACAILRKGGYSVIAAATPQEAIETCETQRTQIDLLLTDVVLPEIDGRRLADRLSRSRPEMKVLYMSGYTDDAIVHRGVLESGTAFIEKPLRAVTLLERVAEVLGLDGPDDPTD